MPWTKINYPDSMKKLPVVVRNKAIEIANAILKENKKMKEGMLIATAIKKAKVIAEKIEKKTKSAVKKEVIMVTKKKPKSPAKKKVKSVAARKTKSAVKEKTKVLAEKKIKIAAKKNTKSIAEKKTKSIAGKKVKKSPASKTEMRNVELPVVEKITHGDDLHLIPVQGEIHPIGTLEAHQLENTFRQRGEVAFHQENQKMKEAMSTRKNAKRIFRFSKRS